MRLTDRIEKIKRIPDIARDSFVAALIVLVALASFALGRLSALDQEKGEGIRIIQGNEIASGSPDLSSGGIHESIGKTEAGSEPKGAYVGSKSGSTYHLPWCSGASRIKEENKIWFPTKGDAERLGYHPAGNCKGI